MKTPTAFAVASLLLALLTLGAAPAPIDGTWSGVLNFPKQPLLLVLKIDGSGDALSAAASSPYQGGGTIPVDTISEDNEKLTFTIAKLHVSFTGTIAQDRIDGTFTQNGTSVPLAFLPDALGTRDLRGAWLGTLDLGSANLLLALRIAHDTNGWSVLLDSPSQGAFGIAVPTVRVTASELSFDIPAIGASYHGRFTADTIDGTFTQGDASLPLTFTRPQIAQAVTPEATPLPTPAPHFSSRDVTFASTGGTMLAGTLTTPDDARGRLPAFVFVHGSGPETRDGGIAQNPTFRDLSNALSNAGAIVLRYDKRGIGASTGTATEAWQPLAADARAAIDYLLHQPHVDPHRIYLLGHSEGGIIVPLVARNDPRVAGIVLLAPPAVPMGRILQEQSPRMTPAIYATLQRAFASYDGSTPRRLSNTSTCRSSSCKAPPISKCSRRICIISPKPRAPRTKISPSIV